MILIRLPILRRRWSSSKIGRIQSKSKSPIPKGWENWLTKVAIFASTYNIQMDQIIPSDVSWFWFVSLYSEEDDQVRKLAGFNLLFTKSPIPKGWENWLTKVAIFASTYNIQMDQIIPSDVSWFWFVSLYSEEDDQVRKLAGFSLCLWASRIITHGYGNYSAKHAKIYSCTLYSK